MMTHIAKLSRKGGLIAALALIAAGPAMWQAPVAAQQMETIDPDLGIDADLDGAPTAQVETAPQGEISPQLEPVLPEAAQPSSRYDQPQLDLPSADGGEAYPSPEELAQSSADADGVSAQQLEGTYGRDDLIGAAEGLFGEGAEGLARMIEDVLEDQGQPNGYIVGREGGGAFVLGVRYGSGTLHHAIEGNMPIYWTGPSIGLDAGANAGNTFVLVYNLYDTEQLYERFPAGEGQAYLVGGFHVSYMRKGDIVLIPIRVGAGLRLGVNAGYMRFSHRQRWLPF